MLDLRWKFVFRLHYPVHLSCRETPPQNSVPIIFLHYLNVKKSEKIKLRWNSRFSVYSLNSMNKRQNLRLGLKKKVTVLHKHSLLVNFGLKIFVTELVSCTLSYIIQLFRLVLTCSSACKENPVWRVPRKAQSLSINHFRSSYLIVLHYRWSHACVHV